MIFAELACSSDDECIGILDDDCDDGGSFRLCRKGFISPSSNIIQSCIYKKKTYTGALLYTFLFHCFINCISHIHTCTGFDVCLQKKMGQHALTLICTHRNMVIHGS